MVKKINTEINTKGRSCCSLARNNSFVFHYSQIKMSLFPHDLEATYYSTFMELPALLSADSCQSPVSHFKRYLFKETSVVSYPW